MTWHAQDGKLVLEGDEGALFRDSILMMSDAIACAADDEDSSFDAAAVFDSMSRSQQLAALAVVARYLFHETPECLPLTAWSEATLASVLREVKRKVVFEVVEGKGDRHRRAVLEATGLADEVEDYDDADEWDMLMDAYEDRFLWDDDYADVEIPDLAPGPASLTRHMLGILDDYYTAVPPDLPAGVSLQQGAKRVELAIDGE